MTRKIALTLLALLALAAPAQASWWRKSWQWHSGQQAVTRATGTCPFDGPDRMFTIVNAGVTGVTLRQIAAIEQATRDESFALRMYYGTPCARFGPGGKPIYLSDGDAQPESDGDTHYSIGGVHYPDRIYVETGLLNYAGWARPFTHEVMEDLVNPTDTRMFGTFMAEVCDPVENLTYPVDGLQVTDFVTPAWFNHGPGPLDAAHVL